VRLLPLAVGALVAACGPSPKSTWSPGTSHVDRDVDGDGEATRKIPALTLAQAAEALARARDEGDAFGIVVYTNRALAAGATPSPTPAAELRAAVDRLDADLLVAAWAELDPDHAPAAAVALRRALVSSHTGADTAALEWADRAMRLAGDDAALSVRAAELRADVESRTAVDPATVAVLLPLSGRFEAVGREIEVAVKLAASADPDAKLVFVDTAGDEAGAATAVDQAVRNHRAVAILGPVGQRESRAAATRATELGIPIALLAPGAGGAAVDAGVFRLWPSGSSLAEAAAREAVRRGYDALAVLAPRDEYGWAQRQAFADAATAAGARVVAEGDYDPTASDLEPDLERFLGLDPKTNERYRKHLRKYKKDGWKTFSPDVPFDLLFIPDEYQRAALVASYLPFFNVELRGTDFVDTVALKKKHGGRVPSLVQLMGSPGWHHAGLLPRGGDAVEGALVVDVCAGGDSEEFASEGAAAFHDAFKRRRGRAPGATAAQAYDAALLVIAARRDADSRADFAARLGRSRIEDGACGAAHVGPAGEIERSVIVLRVDGGEFVVEQ
jgi:ABC-type branched-subunit amino acid transport system substrate-binding protein